MQDMICCVLVFALLLGGSLAATGTSQTDTPTCGYDSCNKEKPGMINVHLIPHTHNDPGWLITVDQYYYSFVQWILGSVIPELEADPSKRFIYVEMSFFSRWWADDIGDDMRQRVRKLVNEGRFEFILGGWVMNDEAATHYSAIIDQHKRGFEFLRENFGECARPKIGWQIDPFGHSREQASIFARFGFDAQFLGRIDTQDKDLRHAEQRMEMIMEGSPNNLGPTASLFTGILPNLYIWPTGFTLDIKYAYKPYKKHYIGPFIQDNPNLYEYNKEQKIQQFIEDIMEYREWFGTDHVIATMGGDFNYVDAILNFREIDKLIKYVNEKQITNSSRINLLYSTPSCYLKAVHGDKRTYTTKEDDFFPYGNKNHTYWTGYFTSRPSQKYFTRYSNSHNQAAKKLAAIARVNNTKGSLDKLVALENSVSLLQHHDAITGTEKQAVTYDYYNRMTASLQLSKDVVNEAYSSLIPKASKAPEQIFCHYSNVSVCSVSQNFSNFEVILFNAKASSRSFIVRVPVNGRSYQVYASDGKTKVPCDVFHVMPSVPGIRPHNLKPAKYEIVFKANVTGMAFRTFFVQKDSKIGFQTEVEKARSSPDRSIEGDFYRVDFDAKGNMKSITNKKDGLKTNFTQNFFYYKGFQGDNLGPDHQSSGAYVFRPTTIKPFSLPIMKLDGIVKGQVVQEARQQFSKWITQVVRVYSDIPIIELEWTVGPIPVADNVSKEVITRYNIPGWGNNGIFYTDSNGREMLKRKLNYRPTWPLFIDEPVAGNYYPINTIFHSKSGDGKFGFAVIPDRAEGGSSLNDGDVELMLHRRLLNDDEFGVAEALNEPGLNKKGLVIRGKHRIVFGKSETIARLYRKEAQNTFQQPLITYSHSGLTPDAYVKKFVTKSSALVRPDCLPEQVNLLSFEKFRHSGPIPSASGTVPYLVRFEHFFEKGEDTQLSQAVSFDVTNIFKGFAIHSLFEISLGANTAVTDVNRLVWKTSGGETPSGLARTLNGTTVHLKPMQIATLQINFKVQQAQSNRIKFD